MQESSVNEGATFTAPNHTITPANDFTSGNTFPKHGFISHDNNTVGSLSESKQPSQHKSTVNNSEDKNMAVPPITVSAQTSQANNDKNQKGNNAVF